MLSDCDYDGSKPKSRSTEISQLILLAIFLTFFQMFWIDNY